MSSSKKTQRADVAEVKNEDEDGDEDAKRPRKRGRVENETETHDADADGDGDEDGDEDGDGDEDEDGDGDVDSCACMPATPPYYATASEPEPEPESASAPVMDSENLCALTEEAAAEDALKELEEFVTSEALIAVKTICEHQLCLTDPDAALEGLQTYREKLCAKFNCLADRFARPVSDAELEIEKAQMPMRDVTEVARAMAHEKRYRAVKDAFWSLRDKVDLAMLSLQTKIQELA
jgi:hypothetical protein